jgi:ABC-type transporter Mla subunit MlaD
LKKDSEGFDAGDTSLTGDAYLATLPAGSQSLVKELGTGKIALSRLDYLLTRKPEVLEAVSRAYPDFDSSKVQGYTNAVKEYTSSKNGTAGAQLLSGSTALKHLNELKEFNTLKSRIPHTVDYNNYNNKLDTLTGELATFYNLPKTDKTIQDMKSTLGDFANRDAAIQTQAQSMGDRFDGLEQTWKNAAPSKAYEAPMPQVDSAALKARAKLDPRYAARAKGQAPPPQNQNKPAQNFAATSSDGKWGWDGKAWVATGK